MEISCAETGDSDGSGPPSGVGHCQDFDGLGAWRWDFDRCGWSQRFGCIRAMPHRRHMQVRLGWPMAKVHSLMMTVSIKVT